VLSLVGGKRHEICEAYLAVWWSQVCIWVPVGVTRLRARSTNQKKRAFILMHVILRKNILVVWLPVDIGSLMEEEAGKKSFSRRFLLTRYFLHGIAFSLLLSILAVGWAFLTVFLLFGLWIIGLAVGIVLLLFIIGGLNTFLTESIWHLQMKEDWKNILVHGLFLIIALFFVGIPHLIVSLTIPSWITTVALFVVYCFIDGFIGLRIAYIWEKRTSYDNILPYHD
jgi:hypothetical protein